MKLRSGDERVMMRFCDSWLSCVIGKNDWKKRRTKEKISEIATASDEAFALLVLENIWDEWIKVPIEEWENSKNKRQEDDEEDDEEEAVGVEKASQDLQEGARRKGRCRAGKYTKGYIAAGKYMGWTNEGMEKYNDLLKQVKADRAKDSEFEEKYLERNRRKFGSKVIRKKYSGAETVISEEDIDAW